MENLGDRWKNTSEKFRSGTRFGKFRRERDVPSGTTRITDDACVAGLDLPHWRMNKISGLNTKFHMSVPAYYTYLGTFTPVLLWQLLIPVGIRNCLSGQNLRLRCVAGC